MTRSLKVAFLDAYHGGSHAAFARTLAKHSRHHVEIVAMPARKWKWRMRGAALWFTLEETAWLRRMEGALDAIVCTDMLSVTDLRALLPGAMRHIPIACYFHENQLTYPLPPHDSRDYQYGMTNLTSCLAADVVLFNSHAHLGDFLAAAKAFLRMMPDCVPVGMVDAILGKSRVCPPPIDFQPAAREPKRPDDPMTILWCHRWEADKQPEPFFEALWELDRAGCSFDVVLLGEQFRTAPDVFAQASAALARRIRFQGHIADRSEYARVLATCDVVVSTAVHETFGMAVLEAILAGCQPLLPRRQSYPEIIPEVLHEQCLFDDDADLASRLRAILDGPARLPSAFMEQLRDDVSSRFAGPSSVARIDAVLRDLASANGCR